MGASSRITGNLDYCPHKVPDVSLSLSLSLGVPLPLNVSKKPAGRVSRWHEQLGLVTGLTAKHTPAQRCVYIYIYIYIYTPGGFIAIKYIAMISYDMI